MVDAGTQDANHQESETSSLHEPGDPQVILTCPATSNFAHGVVVQIPTFPAVSIRTRSTLFVIIGR